MKTEKNEFNCVTIHLFIYTFIHSFIHPSVSYLYFIWGWGATSGGFTSFWPFRPRPPPLPPIFPSLYCICISIDSFFFYDYPIIYAFETACFFTSSTISASQHIKHRNINNPIPLAIWAWYKYYFRDNYLPKTQLNVIHQLTPLFVIQYNFAVFDPFYFRFLYMIFLGQNNSSLIVSILNWICKCTGKAFHALTRMVMRISESMTLANVNNFLY